jgi:sporulation protein YlmC with PRC-barrel domain
MGGRTFARLEIPMEELMKALTLAVAAALVGGVVSAYADTNPLTTLPQSAVTVTDYYKQNVYDPSNNKIGEIEDALVEKDGRIAAFIIGIGGVLGAGEKDVAVPFDAVKASQQDGKWTLTMNATADQLKNAPGFKYDRSTTTWVPDNKK